MYTFSPVSVGSRVENIFLSKHTWQVELVSIHHSLGLDPTKFTSEITNVRLMIDTSLEMPSTTLVSLGLFLFGSLQSKDM